MLAVNKENFFLSITKCLMFYYAISDCMPQLVIIEYCRNAVRLLFHPETIYFSTRTVYLYAHTAWIAIDKCTFSIFNSVLCKITSSVARQVDV